MEKCQSTPRRDTTLDVITSAERAFILSRLAKRQETAQLLESMTIPTKPSQRGMHSRSAVRVATTSRPAAFDQQAYLKRREDMGVAVLQATAWFLLGYAVALRGF